MTYDPRLTVVDLDTLNQRITALDMQKANASTVGGIATRLNAAESDIATKAAASAVTALSSTVANKADASAVATALGTKADVSALASKADTSALALKADATALASKADVSALATKADSSAVTSALATKADAATVTSLSSSVASKADTTALTALAATVPVITNEAPLAEAVSPTAGIDGMKVPGGKHQHPRLSSTTQATIATGSTVTVTFSRTFTTPPGVVFTEIGGATGATAQPAVFKVESWVMTGSLYTGCVVRAWRGQTLPQNLVTLLLTAIYNLFGASVVGTVFSCVAIARSDV